MALSTGDGTSVIASIPMQSGVALAGYERLHSGMTYAEAVAALGRPGQENSRSEMVGLTTVMYSWTGAGSIGANMNAMFQNDRLINKAQFGLQ